MRTNKKCPKYVDPSGALPNPGYVIQGGSGGGASGGAGGSMMSPPHSSIRSGSIPPVTGAAAGTPGRGPSGSDYFRQGSPQSSNTGGNKISIPKAIIDRVVDQEKEREREDKDALVVRLPTKMLQSVPKRKRSESASHHADQDDYEDYFPPVKSYGRRKKPDVELANIIESVLSTILSMQEATAFLAPVSSKIAPGYDIVIKQPRDLSGMRDANKNYYAYRTVDSFLTDMRIMVNNSWIYNGEHSLWTQAGQALLKKAEEILAPQAETIRQLEQEILEADVKANIFPGGITPSGTSEASTAAAAAAALPSLHPGGYGVYTSMTFPGIGKPFTGFGAAPIAGKPMQPTLPQGTGADANPGGSGDVHVKMEWE